MLARTFGFSGRRGDADDFMAAASELGCVGAVAAAHVEDAQVLSRYQVEQGAITDASVATPGVVVDCVHAATYSKISPFATLWHIRLGAPR